VNPAGPPAGTRPYWALFALAALSFVWLPGHVQYTGEEAVYSVQAYEQWQHGAWLQPTFLGGPYQRPPLFNWLIIVLSNALGWTHCLLAARLVSALATIGSGVLLAAFSRRLGAEPARAAFIALVYLTLAEPLFYYGWLGYSDALFGALVLAGMLAAWLAAREQRVIWVAVALLCAAAAFFTKALTAYVFIGVAGLVCLRRYRTWPLIVRPRVLACLPLCALPLLWYALAPTGGVMAHGMVDDIAGKLGQQGLIPYLRHLVVYPAHALLNLMPAAALLLWLRRETLTVAPMGAAAPIGHTARTAALIAGLNFLPYWLAPQSGLRYLMPLYGLAAVFVGEQLWRASLHRHLILRVLAVAIALKWLAAVWLFPAYTQRARPDLAVLAATVDQLAHGRPLYADTDAWVGISVVALLDTTPDASGAARPALVRPPHDWAEGLVLSDQPAAADDPSRLVRDFGAVRLLCRGAACPPP
jgi:4-amino-4-deoxy-L-arabinose transferase-like glycosyltransferase